MMEDDIRDLVHGASPPRPDAKSLKSRSKSTTAKSSKKKKKPTDSKSKSKSTTTGKKKREKNAPPVLDPATLTIQVPPVPPVTVSLPLATGTASPLPVPLPAPKSSVSEHLREIINDPTIPVATPTPSTRADTHVDSQQKDKASKPRKKKESNRPTTSSKRKEQQTQNQPHQQQNQQQQDEEGEEKRKRRERLMVSPFEYLHITPFRHGEEDFHDDISFLTLPKPLRDQETQAIGNSFSLEEDLHHENHLSHLEDEQVTPQPEVPTGNSASHQINDDTTLDPPAIDTPATDQLQPLPAPGWARKSKFERTAKTKEQASTDLSHSPELSSLPSAHLDCPSPVFSVTATHDASTAIPQLETRNEKSVNRPKNHLPQKEPPMEQTKTIQVIAPKTLHPTLDRTRSCNNVNLPIRDPPPPAPHLEQDSPSVTHHETPAEKRQYSWLLFARWLRKVTIQKLTGGTQPNCDVESGHPQHTQMRMQENKSTLTHLSRKHALWCIASAVISFFCLVILTAILVVILAKG